MATFTKLVKGRENVEREMKLQDLSSIMGFSPNVISKTLVSDDTWELKMNKVHGKTLYEIYGDDASKVPDDVWEEIRHIINTLYKEKGIVYVDITPFNFMMDDYRDVLIIDFGDAYYEEYGEDGEEVIPRNWFHEQFLDDCINSWNPDFK